MRGLSNHFMAMAEGCAVVLALQSTVLEGVKVCVVPRMVHGYVQCTVYYSYDCIIMVSFLKSFTLCYITL